MEHFASGWKESYYGKGDVIVYRLNRSATSSQQSVFGANVLMLLYGDAFWPTYTTGDNTGLIATDSMKNFIQRETLNFEGNDLEGLCRFLASKFAGHYRQVEGLQVSATEIPYAPLDREAAFVPAGPERATARFELRQGAVVEAVSGLKGFRLLRLGGSAFEGFVRDEYTTLPDKEDRPLHMGLDAEWTYVAPSAFESGGHVTTRIRSIVHDVFQDFESGSIQQVIYQMATRILSDLPAVAEVHLEANNRTWDTIVERDDAGTFTDARPPYGCLGLRLRR